MFVPVEGLEPNHSKDVLEETDDLWDYFDEKRDALERFENYLLRLQDNEGAAAAESATAKHAPPTSRRAQTRAARSQNA